MDNRTPVRLGRNLFQFEQTSNSSWIQEANLVFLVGCPRSGTTWLQAMLASHPEIVTATETHFFENFYAVFKAYQIHSSMKGSRNIGLPAYLSEEQFRKVMRDMFWSLISSIPSPTTKPKYFLEKTPQHGLYADFILELFPNARFVHIIRDARPVSASLLRASKGWGKSWAPQTADAAAHFWSRYVLETRKIPQLVQEPNLYYELKYEDLTINTHTYLCEIFDWLSLITDYGLINSIVDSNSLSQIKSSNDTFSSIVQPGNGYPENFIGPAPISVDDVELTKTQRLVIEYIAGSILKDFDYPHVQDSFSLLDKASIFKECFWPRYKKSGINGLKRLREIFV